MKKIFLTISLVILASLCSIAFAGCCEHKWVFESDTSTCGEAGTITFKCRLCGDTKTEKGSPTGKHSEGTFIKIVDPTVSSGGYYLYKCDTCGQEYKTKETKSITEEAKVGEKEIIDTIKSRLKDPDSLLYSGRCYTVYDTIEGKAQPSWIYYEIKYNAKNGFGGYVGYQTVYYCWNSYFQSVVKLSANTFYDGIDSILFSF